ncbi:MAG: molybdopterin-dependent oxidoreductase, partial [Pseudomonadota bacterium]
KPLKRVGPRGSGKWKSVSWDEAFQQIVHGGDLFGEGPVDGLKLIRERGSGLGVLAGQADWGALTFLRGFVSAFPSGKLMRDRGSVQADLARLAAEDVFGPGTGPVEADYRNARFVLSFGDAPLDSGVPLVSLAREIAEARTSSPGFKWAVVDPRLSTSASKADQWVPVTPGRDLWLALGIMRALAEYHSGSITFPNEGLRRTVSERGVADYAHDCGVSVDTVRALAHRLTDEGKYSAVIPGRGILSKPNGLETAKVVLTLNLMVGSVPGSGGLMGSRPDFLKTAERKVLGQSVKDEDAVVYGSPAKALINWDADPVYDDPASGPDYFGDRAKVPLFVAIDREVTETSALADYILPDTTYLERWDICASPASVAVPGVGVRTPVVGAFDPLTGVYAPILPETKPMEDVVFQLAARCGVPGFEPDAKGRIKTAWDFYPPTLTKVLEAMNESELPVPATDEFSRKVFERGGIFLPGHSRPAETKTASGPYKPPVIEVKAPPSASDPGTFLLITYSLPFRRSPRSGLNSWLLEVMPENRVMINSSDAKRLGIKELDAIVIETPDGKTKLKGKAQTVPGVKPGTVALAAGFGCMYFASNPTTVDNIESAFSKTRGAGINPAGLSVVKIKKA